MLQRAKNSNRRISQRSRVKHLCIISCKRGQSQALSCLSDEELVNDPVHLANEAETPQDEESPMDSSS